MGVGRAKRAFQPKPCCDVDAASPPRSSGAEIDVASTGFVLRSWLERRWWAPRDGVRVLELLANGHVEACSPSAEPVLTAD